MYAVFMKNIFDYFLHRCGHFIAIDITGQFTVFNMTVWYISTCIFLTFSVKWHCVFNPVWILFKLFNPCLIAPSEGSVIAYYLSEFKVPVGQESAVDNAMSAMDKLVDKEQRSVYRPGNSLVLEDVVSSGKGKATKA